MDDERMREFIDLEARKLAIQWAAVEIRIDDKLRAYERRVVDAIRIALDAAVTELRTELQAIGSGPTSPGQSGRSAAGRVRGPEGCSPFRSS